MKTQLLLFLVMYATGAIASTAAQGSTRCTHGGIQIPVIVPCFATCAGSLKHGCQAGPLRIGTTNATSLTLATDDCSDRIVIDANGAVVINMPTAGEALTVNGNIVLPVVNAAGTQGILKLGGTGSSRVNVYEAGVRNFFAGSGSLNAVITGTNNISIGTDANAVLVTASNNIAIGTSTVATGTDSIALGNRANSTLGRTIVIGSRDSTSTGAAPTATGTAANAIVMGSAQGALAGARSTSIATVALGSSDGTFAGAVATGSRVCAFGVNATASAAQCIAMGSASGVVGGTGPTASTSSGAIALGSAWGVRAGASATGIGAIALGGADGVSTAISVLSARGVGVGVGVILLNPCTAIGSAAGLGGSAASATGISSVGIGSGRGALAGATAGGASMSVALGGSNGTFAGARAVGTRGIAMGVNAIVSVNQGIAIGSASDIVGGTSAAVTNNVNGIAVGSAQDIQRGAQTTGLASVALAGSDGVSVGAASQATRAIGIGCGASTAQADAILLGRAAATSVRVGIGIAAPAAKLDIVGADGTPVWRFNQVNTAIGNSITWLNRSTGVDAATNAIHYNIIDATSVYWFGLSSSRRYKTNVRPIDNQSAVIYLLKAVLYDSREEYGEGKDIPGFIAEQVSEVAPHLVVLNGDKQPENIAYNSLHALIIKELQKCQKTLRKQHAVLSEHARALGVLAREVAELEDMPI